MKKILITFVLSLIMVSAFTQTPVKIRPGFVSYDSSRHTSKVTFQDTIYIDYASLSDTLMWAVINPATGSFYLLTHSQADSYLDQNLNFSTAGYIPYTNTDVDGYSYDSLFKYTAASSILDAPYTLHINSRSAGTDGVADAKPAYLRFRDGEEDIMAELYTSSVTGNLILATRISGGEIQSLDGLNISSGSLSLQSGASVNNIQTTIGNSDIAIPSSGAVVDYVADNLDSIFYTITLTPISDVGSPAEGEMFYDSDDNIAKIWNGTAWDTINVVGSGSGGGTTYSAGSGLTLEGSAFELGGTLDTDSTTNLVGDNHDMWTRIESSGDNAWFVDRVDMETNGFEYWLSGGSNAFGLNSGFHQSYNGSTELYTVRMFNGSDEIAVNDSGTVVKGDFYFPDLADTVDAWLLVSANTGKVDTGQLVEAKLGLEETMPNYKHWLKDRKDGEIKWPYLEDGEIVWKYGINDVKQFQFNIQSTIEIILRKQYKQQIHAWINTGILTLVVLLLLFFIVFIVRQLI